MVNPVYCTILIETDGVECHLEGWLCEVSTDVLFIQPSRAFDPEGVRIGIPAKDMTMIYPTVPNEPLPMTDQDWERIMKYVNDEWEKLKRQPDRPFPGTE